MKPPPLIDRGILKLVKEIAVCIFKMYYQTFLFNSILSKKCSIESNLAFTKMGLFEFASLNFNFECDECVLFNLLSHNSYFYNENK